MKINRTIYIFGYRIKLFFSISKPQKTEALVYEFLKKGGNVE